MIDRRAALSDATFLRGGGQMGAAIRAFDWAASPLGPPDQWSSQLRTAVALMLGASQPVYIAYGPELTSLYNDGYLPIVGDKHPAGLGTPFSALWAEIWTDFKPIVEATMAGEAQHFVDLPIALGGRPDRPLGYFTFSYTALRDDEGRAVGLYCAATETTEQVEQSSRLRESESRLQLALAGGRGVGTWDWDVPNDRVVADERFATLYGVDLDQARDGAPIAEFFSGIHPDDVARVQAQVGEALRSGETFSAEYRLVQPDGSSKWVLAEGRCQLAPDGSPLRFPGMSFDISERKFAEIRAEVLVDLTDRIRDIDEPSELAYAACHLLGEYFQVSRVGYGLIDGPTETITIERDWNGPGIPSLAGVLNFRDYGSYIEDLLAGRTVAIADASEDPRTADNAGALKALAAQAFVNMPVVEQGGLVGLLFLTHRAARTWSTGELSLIREVAERVRTATERLRASKALRESEARLLQANETLEANVVSRTAELMQAEEALRQAQKMEAVGQLTGGIAHDFNNLLMGMMGNLELLQSRIARGRIDDLDRFVLAAQGAGKRATSLTQRLLAFSRRQTLDPKPTDVNRLVAGMEDLLRRTMGPEVTVEIVGAAGLWTASIDAGQLENALLNLCINARDAMPAGGRLTIETANKWLDDRAAKERDLAAGQYLSICVTDTGVGMEAATIARAFEPFYTTKPIGQGTGLGLSMVYGFARQSGGQVRIYSELGMGTTFCVYLPRHTGDAEDAEVEAEWSASAAAAGQSVLVVDDESTIRHLIAEVLEGLGYTVIAVPDGAAALKVLGAGAEVDLLITDVGLPNGLNGRQVADAARTLNSALKVLFITGYAENAAVGNGHLEPGMALLTKPFSLEALAAKISEMMAAVATP